MLYTALTRFINSCIFVSKSGSLLREAAVRKEPWRSDNLNRKIRDPEQERALTIDDIDEIDPRDFYDAD